MSYNVSDAAVQSRQASWLTRVMSSHGSGGTVRIVATPPTAQQQNDTESLDGTDVGAVHTAASPTGYGYGAPAETLGGSGFMTRSYTPLRPNASMLQRIPTPQQQQQRAGGFNNSKPASRQSNTNTTNRPTTVGSNMPPLHPGKLTREQQQQRQADQQHPNSARAGNSASSSQQQQLQQPAAAKSNPPSPSKGENIMSPLHSIKEDVFAAHEDKLLEELNLCRQDPAAYAVHVEAELVVHDGFLPDDKDPMNLAEITTFSNELNQNLEEATNALDSLEDAQRKEISALKDQWAAEDNDRNKKKGKAAPPPKKANKDGTMPAAPPTTEEIEAEREQTLKDVSRRNDEKREELTKAIEEIAAEAQRAENGVKQLTMLIARLKATKPLHPVRLNRGLSLAARDICAELGKTGAVGAKTDDYVARYGSGDGPYSHVCIEGVMDVRMTVMSMLLCLNDTRRKGRFALLDKRHVCAGCGWRRYDAKGSASCIVLAAHFSEFSAIAQRDHLPLQDVRHVLPLAKDATEGKTLVRLHTSLDIQVLTPKAHPVSVGNTFVAMFRCPGTVYFCAKVIPESEADLPENQNMKPVYIPGELLVQRKDETTVELRAIMPYEGKHRVVIFARDEAAKNGGIFTKVGSFSVVSDRFKKSDAWRRYPTISADFHERKCQVISPLDGLLPMEHEMTFHIAIPLTDYKMKDIQRVSAALEEANNKASGSKEETEALMQEVESKKAEVEAAKTQREANLPQLQQELAACSKDLGKKKGKELERAKSAVADVEERIATLERSVESKTTELAEAEQRLSSLRRSQRQASANRRRYRHEQDQLTAATDRSKPLNVEISIDDRRAPMRSCSSDHTEYKATIRTPPVDARVSIFISGIVAVTYEVCSTPVTLQHQPTALM